jgi:hypothetical protein
MSQDEEFVRQHWVSVERVLEMIQGGSWHFKEGYGLKEAGFKPAIGEELWAAAAEFTRERQRQIAEIEEEILWFAGLFAGLRLESGIYLIPTAEHTARRILCRLQDALAALKKGMRTC